MSGRKWGQSVRMWRNKSFSLKTCTFLQHFLCNLCNLRHNYIVQLYKICCFILTREKKKSDFSPEEEEDRGQDTLGGWKEVTAKETQTVKNEIGYIWWAALPQHITPILFMEMDSWADQWADVLLKYPPAQPHSANCPACEKTSSLSEGCWMEIWWTLR